MNTNKISIPVNLEVDLGTSEITLDGFPMSLNKEGFDQLKNLVTQRLMETIKFPEAEAETLDVVKPRASTKSAATRAATGQRIKTWWAERKASGLCIRCDTKAVTDYCYCRIHLRESRRYAAKRWSIK